MSPSNRVQVTTAFCMAFAVAAATGPARAGDAYPDRPGMHVVAGSPPQEIGACMIDMQAWFAYSKVKELEVSPWIYQAYSAFEREVARTKAGLDAAWIGMHAESDRLDAVKASRGAWALAQESSDRVQTCGGYVVID